jgi:lipoate---protein ligase
MFIQRCLISGESNPYFNLAAEEYFLKNTDDEIFMLYINDPSVIVGKHQNLLKEIKASWCYKHNIKLARRLSGGGTVYQDQGNINFSFILNCPSLDKLNYQRFTYPIIKALISLGLDVEYSDRNDILLKGSKISGNAMHIFKSRALCHGTLLFKSDLKDLSASLKNNADHYVDKSIPSVPSKVVNISEFLTEDTTEDIFIEKLFQYITEFLDSPQKYILKEFEIEKINKLGKEKYSSWDWIYGYSPKYLFRNHFSLNNKMIEFELNVEKGIIVDANSDNGNIKSLLNKHLIGVRHDYESLNEAYTFTKFADDFQCYSDDDFCNLFF